MLDFITILVIGVVLGCFSIGIVLFFMYQSSKKNQNWHARCWQIGQGVRKIERKTVILKTKDGKVLKDKDGKPQYKKIIIKDPIRCKDLITYAEDMIIKTTDKNGLDLYQLKKLKMSINPVTADNVSVWGDKRKEVDVLIQEDNATIMTKGYDHVRGIKIFQPLNRDTMEMLKSDLIIKKERREEKKENWMETLGKYGTYMFIGLVILVCFYVTITKQVEISEINKKTADIQSKAQIELAKINENNMNECLSYVNNREAVVKQQNNIPVMK